MVALSPAPDLRQSYLRADGRDLHLHLPLSLDWEDLWDHLSWQLQAQRPFWQIGSRLTLWAEERPLDSVQIQAIAALIHQHRLVLSCVQTRHRATAVAAAQLGYSVTQTLPLSPPQSIHTEAPLYLTSTIRSGTEVCHPASVIVLGDVNPGAELIAGGDVIVLGRLRGIAHAGFPQDPTSLIIAMQLEPTQLRIAEQVARPPDGSSPHPEVAYLNEGMICIAGVQDYLSLYRAAKGSL